MIESIVGFVTACYRQLCVHVDGAMVPSYPSFFMKSGLDDHAMLPSPLS